jgi:hypothetical protein
MRIGGTFVALTLALALSRALHGQESDTIEPGERVRVERRGIAGSLRGEVLVLLHDTLVVNGVTGSQATLVPLDQVTSLHVYRGRKSGAEIGGGIGAIAGFVVGAVLGIGTAPFAVDDCSVDEDGERPLSCLADAGWVLLAGAAVAVPAYVLGDLLGRPFQMDDWQRMRTDRLRFRIGPLPGGSVGVGFSVAF